MQVITFSRSQLYDLVWSDSLVALSKKYNISDNGLRKACIRMGIPLPNMGHWNKIKAGKKVLVKPFPKEHEGDQEISLSLRVNGEDFPESGLSPQLTLQKEIESDLQLDLSVKETLVNPDALILKAEKELLRKDKYRKEGDLVYSGFGNLDIKVSANLVNRALCIMDTFVKAMRHRGHSFEFNKEESYLLLFGIKLKMTLKENRNRVIPQDKWRSIEFQPNGILSFQFGDIIRTVSCTDGKILIEHQLSKLIAKIEILGEEMRIEDIKWQKYRDEQHLKQLNEKEKQERKKIELSSFMNLLAKSCRWDEAQTLRNFIDQTEQKAIAENNLTEELSIWIEWARKKADWFDPLTDGEDEWLKDVNPNSLISQSNDNSRPANSHYQMPEKEKSNWPLLPWYLKNR